MIGKRRVCAICGRVLPTKYAVAGSCIADGCDRDFCSLHWHNGNRRCPEHGWEPCGVLVHEDRPIAKATIFSPEAGVAQTELASTESKESFNSEEEKMENDNGKDLCERAAKELQPEKKASIIKSISEFAVKLGQGAGQLAKKISGYKSPEEAMNEIDSQIETNRARREPAVKRYEELYGQIVQKKKAYQVAPAARKRILELELKSMIAEYQSLERQVAAYLNNEMILTKVKGRMCELVAMSLKTVKEDDIDKLIDKVDDAVASDEDIDGAMADLDKAGSRREHDDAGAFEEALAGFGDELPETPGFDVSEPGSPVPEKKADPLEI